MTPAIAAKPRREVPHALLHDADSFNRSDLARPEHTLVFAATDVVRDAATRESIDRALAAAPDWTRVIELALAHRLTPALLAALDAADPSLVPANLLAALRQHCGELRARSMALVAELHALLDTLSQQGVVAVPFKGPHLAEFLFGDPGMRPPGDLDLLVRLKDVPRVCEVLEARGYVDGGYRPGPRLTPSQQIMYRRYQCEYRFARAADGVSVEPHWAFAQRVLAIEVDYAGIFDRLHRTSLGGRSVATLAPEDLLLALCIHGSKHHWQRLAWIRDVAALMTRCADLDLEQCVARARPAGCARLLLIGLALARRCGGAPLPVAVRRQIEQDHTAVALGQQVLKWMFDPDKPPADNDNVDRFRFLMRERWNDRIRYAARTWLWPRRRHIEMVALPGALHWAYFPLMWAHDYAALPLWRLAQISLGRGSLEWARGTRAARERSKVP